MEKVVLAVGWGPGGRRGWMGAAPTVGPAVALDRQLMGRLGVGRV